MESFCSIRDIKYIINTVLNEWKTITLIGLIAAICSSIVGVFIIDPTYEVRAKIFIGKQQSYNSPYDESEIRMYQGLTKTYSEILSTRDIISKAILNNGIDESEDVVLNSLEITPGSDMQIIEVSYKGEDRVKDYNILVALLNEYTNEAKGIIQNGNIKVIERPTLPIYPINSVKCLSIIVIGTLLPILLSIAIILFREYFNNTIKNKDMIEEIFNVSILGIIPNCVCEKEVGK